MKQGKEKLDTPVISNMMTKQQRYETLVRAYHTDMYRYALWLIKDPSVAEDVVQETFLRAWKSLDSLLDVKAAKAWLITILRRENARRFERKQLSLVNIDDFDIANADIEQEQRLEHAELRRIINGLSDEYREPLVLQVIMGLSGDEIALALQLNKNTVMTRLFRARNQIKEQLNPSAQLGVNTNG